MNNKQLNEGLRPFDLKEMVESVFEIDSFKSKMGEDRDVCVLSFKVKDRSPAKDLMEFIEKGYNFVLDSDVSSGEDNNGEYSVFVEISRSQKLADQIKELTYGINKLTGIDNFKFRYYKDQASYEVNEDNLRQKIPNTSNDYDIFVSRVRTEGIRRFFSKTLMDDLTINGDIITIHKPFDQKVTLRMIKEGNEETILEGSEDAIQVDTEATSEVFWLTKVLGDYNINKVGENFVFNNGKQAMLIKLEK